MLLIPKQGRKDIEGKELEKRIKMCLKAHNLTMKKRNYVCPVAEIDIIAEGENGLLVFVEIKERNSKTFGEGRDAIDANKKFRMQSACAYYLKYVVKESRQVRFDLMEIYQGIPTYVENIF